MRLSFVNLRKRPRTPQNPNKVVFQEILPLRLKERVSGKSSTREKFSCFQEMMLLFTCLNENNFENKFCDPQIKAFEKCNDNYMATNRAYKLAELSKVPMPNSKNLTHNQITYILRKYPNV